MNCSPGMIVEIRRLHSEPGYERNGDVTPTIDRQDSAHERMGPL